MTTYPNQKVIKIKRDTVKKSTKEPYLTAYKSSIVAAGKVLNGVPFKLYLYLLCNSSDFEMGFSPQHFAEEYGVSLASAKTAFQDLQKAGFIIKNENHKNKYEFYEIQQTTPAYNIVTKVYYGRFRIDNGEYIYLTKKELEEQFGSDAADYWAAAEREDEIYYKNEDDEYVQGGK